MSQPLSKGRVVLVTDDDPEILRAVSIRMKAAGYQTLTAVDGVDCLDTAIRERPDAIVLDIRMPRMDGLTVLTELSKRDETRSIPVVVLSANNAERVGKETLELGARFFLEKPFDAKRLLEAVESAIARATVAAD